MVEYCSELNGDAPSTIYDTLDTKVERHFTESGYLGLKCQCRNGDVVINIIKINRKLINVDMPA